MTLTLMKHLGGRWAPVVASWQAYGEMMMAR